MELQAHGKCRERAQRRVLPSESESMRRQKRDNIILDLEGVSKEYIMGRDLVVSALCDVDLQVKRGEYISVLGPSGSGKSTLLHVMGLLDLPSSGRVCIDGHCAWKMTEDERAYIRGKKIGFVFQVFNLVPSLTALENVALPMMIYNVPRDVREERARGLLEQLGMGNRLNHKPNELSGGQRQRVAIARALANDPPIILADEPTGNLDSKTGEEVVGIFNELHEKGRTLIVVTHDEEIARHADRIVRIRDGMIVKG
ncbi:MAG: ABC transporter ATP-binding protein [Candidatus Micrarchaeota archaeon]|nr:ABC transporter ATP-binding protein [Candidatus Micrarchaeota archaeon]